MRLPVVSDLIYYVFLPLLVFEAAFKIDAVLLRRNLFVILLLSIPCCCCRRRSSRITRLTSA